VIVFSWDKEMSVGGVLLVYQIVFIKFTCKTPPPKVHTYILHIPQYMNIYVVSMVEGRWCNKLAGGEQKQRAAYN
jgi:hypothetical protein